MVLDDTIHIPNRYDRSYSERNPDLGDCNINRSALFDLYRNGMARRQNIPYRYLYARQKANIERPIQVVEILKKGF